MKRASAASEAKRSAGAAGSAASLAQPKLARVTSLDEDEERAELAAAGIDESGALHDCGCLASALCCLPRVLRSCLASIRPCGKQLGSQTHCAARVVSVVTAAEEFAEGEGDEGDEGDDAESAGEGTAPARTGECVFLSPKQ